MKKEWIYQDLAGNEVRFVHTDDLTNDEKVMFEALDNKQAVAIAIIQKSNPKHKVLFDSIKNYTNNRCSITAIFKNEVLTLFYAFYSHIDDLERLRENVEMVFRVIS